MGLPQPAEWLEGSSLLPLLHGRTREGKPFVVSENSYAFRDEVRLPLRQPVERCHMTMLRTARWKLVHFEDLPPQLFDLQEDPGELADLGRSPGHAAVRDELRGLLFDWLRARRRSPTIAPGAIEQWNRREREAGILIGAW